MKDTQLVQLSKCYYFRTMLACARANLGYVSNAEKFDVSTVTMGVACPLLYKPLLLERNSLGSLEGAGFQVEL